MPKHLAILTVKKHPSGRRTLELQVNTESSADLPGPLFGNIDPADFYRAVAQKIADLAASENYRIIFKDSAD